MVHKLLKNLKKYLEKSKPQYIFAIHERVEIRFLYFMIIVQE